MPTDPPLLLFDFEAPAAIDGWDAIDDRVMGGVSHSRLRHDAAGHAVFEGVVSLDRGGGFASVRSRPAALGRPGATACVIEVRGATRSYKLALFDDDGWDSVSHQCSFTPMPDTWQALVLPLAASRPTFRGRTVPDAPALDAARLRQVGLMIADRQAGPFTLDIRRIGLR